MNFPRYINPHSVAHAIQPTSRAELYIDSSKTEDDDDGDSLKAHLESLLLKRGLQLHHDEETTTTTHRRSKRRKFESVGVLSQAVEFRLISSSLPPRILELGPKPPKIIRIKEPEYEDTDEQFEKRRHQAQSVAVDYDWIVGEASKHVHYIPNIDKNPIQLHAWLPVPAPPFMIAERPKLHVKEHRRGIKCLPSPHNLPTSGVLCPIVGVDCNDQFSRKKKRMRCPKSRRVRQTE